MVRRSLAETLSEQALQFLKDGSPRPESGTAGEASTAHAEAPLFGFERAFSVEFWSKEDQSRLRQHFLQKYCSDLEQAGLKVTREGLVQPSRGVAPTTRGLEAEMRLMRREVALLSDLTRHFLRIVVYAGGLDPDRLRDFLCDAIKSASESEPEPEPVPEPASKLELEAPAAEVLAPEIEPEPEPLPVMESTEEREQVLPPRANGHSNGSTSIEEEPVMEQVEAEHEARICPRCARSIPVELTRCLFCGKSL